MQVCWRLGFPGWRVAARLGFPIKIKIEVNHDSDANVYFAFSDDIGLAVEADSLDSLMAEIHCAIPALLEMSHCQVREPRADIRLHDDFVVA